MPRECTVSANANSWEGGVVLGMAAWEVVVVGGLLERNIYSRAYVHLIIPCVHDRVRVCSSERYIVLRSRLETNLALI